MRPDQTGKKHARWSGASLASRSYCIIAYGGELVTRIEEIKNAVVSLPVNEYRRFRDWFLERDWEELSCLLFGVGPRQVSGIETNSIESAL
jgi:hypothetical protein